MNTIAIIELERSSARQKVVQSSFVTSRKSSNVELIKPKELLKKARALASVLLRKDRVAFGFTTFHHLYFNRALSYVPGSKGLSVKSD